MINYATFLAVRSLVFATFQGFGINLTGACPHPTLRLPGRGGTIPAVAEELRNCRLFFRAFPSESEIRYTLCIKLSWSHLREIMRVADLKARTYYLKTAAEDGWDVRELQRQIRMFAYECVVAHQVEDPPPNPASACPMQTLPRFSPRQFRNVVSYH